MSNEPNRPAEGRPLEREVKPPVSGGTAQACEHPNKQEKHFTYGYRWWCPDCKASGEDWWD